MGGVRSSPMGQSSSSPPSQSSGGSQSAQSPTDKLPNQWTQGPGNRFDGPQGQAPQGQRYTDQRPKSGQAIEMKRPSGSMDPDKRYSGTGSGDGSRPSSQDRQTPNQLHGGPPPQQHQHMQRSAVPQQSDCRPRTPSAEHKPKSNHQQQSYQEQRPKTPVGSAADHRGPMADMHRPKTSTGQLNTNPIGVGYDTRETRDGVWNRGMTTSTPKQPLDMLSDPYGRINNVHHTCMTQQQQQHMLQSKSMVPNSLSNPSQSQKQTLSLDPAQWNRSYSDISSQRSITPPLPPLSPGNSPPITPPDSPLLGPSGQHRPDVVTSTAKKTSPNSKKKQQRRSTGGGSVGVKTWDGRSKRSAQGKSAYGRVGPPSRAALLSKPRSSKCAFNKFNYVFLVTMYYILYLVSTMFPKIF